MKPMIKIVLGLGLAFVSIFFAIKLTGVLTIEQIKGWLESAQSLSPLYVASIVTVLLLADLFISVPTLAIAMLAGYFIGAAFGAGAVLVGLMLAGTIGYLLAGVFGEKVLATFMRDESERADAKAAFNQHGFVMILLSRAMPMLPEITACMAGLTRMSFWKFILAWSLSSVPYTLIAVYAGSVSSLDNPYPALFTAVAISGSLGLAWFVFHRKVKAASTDSP